MSTSPDTEWAILVETRFDDLAERVAKLEESLHENTELTAANAEVTAEMRDILTAAKGFFKFAGYFGTFAAWLAKTGIALAALWAGWQAIIAASIPPGKK
jgi:hypothetical protein